MSEVLLAAPAEQVPFKPMVDPQRARAQGGRIGLPWRYELFRAGRGPGCLPELRRARRIQHQRPGRAAPRSYKAAVSELRKGPAAPHRRPVERRRDGELRGLDEATTGACA